QFVAFGARVLAQYREAAVEGDQAQHRLERGGLAGAVGADQADDAAGGDPERGRVQRDGVLVGLAQAVGIDYGVHHASPFSGASSFSASRPRRAIRSRTAGHSSVRKRLRSFSSSLREASSVTYMPRPLRFSTSASSASSW